MHDTFTRLFCHAMVFATLWDEGVTLNEDPPNAVLTWVSGDDISESEITISGAEWHGKGRVTYSFTVTAGDLPVGSLMRASLFVDQASTVSG